MARRICPACGGEHALDSTEPIFPPQWVCARCGHRPTWRDGVPLLTPLSNGGNAGYDPSMFAVLAAVEQGHFWYQPRARLITGLVDKFCADARSVLEIGCGTGFVLAALARARAWRRIAGTDYYGEGLAVARRRLGASVELWQADARFMPAADAFDVVGLFDVIEHIPDDAAVLEAAHRALTARGGIIVAVPQHPWLWSRLDEAAGHVRRYRCGELEQKLAATGFQVIFSTSYMAALLPLMVASRLLFGPAGRTASDSAPRRCHIEFTPGRALNALLRGPLELEVALTLRGVRLPIGGSRIVVARKR